MSTQVGVEVAATLPRRRYLGRSIATVDVEAVLLDNGGVLTLPRPEAIAGVFGGVGIDLDPAVVPRAHDLAVRAYDAHEETAAGQRAFADRFVHAAGVPDADAGEAAAALGTAIREDGHRIWLAARAGAHEGLRSLAQTRVALAVVSNAFGTVASDLRDLELCQEGPGPGVEVGAVLDSAVVGVSKPDPRIFALALERLGSVAPERALHVGDSVRADVDGARMAGLQALHFDPLGLCDDGSHDHVRSLTDLAHDLETGS